MRRDDAASRIRVCGFTYIGLLIFIAIMGVGLAGTGIVFHQQAQREKERELLFIGDQMRRAIGQYYERTPGGSKRFSKSLNELLLDERYPATQRYLRRIYRDPMIGEPEWGLVKGPEDGIVGVYSLSKAQPIKQSGFKAANVAFEGKYRYSDWRFTYVPMVKHETNKSTSRPAVP